MKLALCAVVVAATYDGVPALFDRFWHIHPEVDRALEFITQGSVWTPIYFSAWGILVLQKLNHWRLLHSTVYVVTDERIIKYKHTSMFKMDIQDFPLSSIGEVGSRQGLRSRLLGYGTLTFRKDDGRLVMEWPAVPKPLETLDKVSTIIEQGMSSRKC